MVKYSILLFSTLVLLGGCTCKTQVQTKYIEKDCAKFPIDEFQPAEDYKLEGLKKVDINGISYIQIPTKNFIGFVEEHKNIKKNFNIIIHNLKEFQNQK